MKENQYKIGYFAPNVGRIDTPWTKEITELNKIVGLNFGNMAFWYSCKKLIEGEYFLIQNIQKAERLKNKIDLFVFPAANMLNENTDLGSIAEIMKILNCKVLVIGLGAQSKSELTIPILKEGTLCFLKEASKRTDQIFCRGEYSKKVIKHYGISNVTVNGCSSILLNPDKELGYKLEDRYKNKKISRINIASGRVEESKNFVEKELYDLILKHKGIYSVQHPLILCKGVRNHTLNSHERHALNLIAKNIFKISFQELRSFLQHHGHVFTSMR